MKVAKQKVSVFSPSGKYVIGDLNCGQKTLVLGEVAEGVVIAYVLGLIKPAQSDLLVEMSEFEKEVRERDRFVMWAGLQVGQSGKEFVVSYLRERGLIDSCTKASELYFNHCETIDQNDVVAGDLVFRFVRASGADYVGVYMGDGSVVLGNGREELVAREEFDATVWRRFAQLKAFENDDTTSAIYTRCLKRLRRPMRGDDVRALQTALKSDRFDLCVDGVYGKKTRKAVRAYQREAGLSDDGAVGQITWESLMGGE